jgi:hypothetical protein
MNFKKATKQFSVHKIKYILVLIAKVKSIKKTKVKNLNRKAKNRSEVLKEK